jgi:inositol transport system substrate-binding protein
MALGLLSGCTSPAADAAQTTEPAEATATSEVTAAPEAVEATEAPQKEITIGVSMNAMDNAQTLWYDYLQKAAEELGNVKLVMFDADSNVQKQITDVETLCTLAPDVIIIKAVDPVGSVPAFESCAEAGIPTMAVHFNVDYDKTLKLLLNQGTAASRSADYLIKYLDENPEATLKVGYIWGSKAMPATQARYNGWKEPLMAKYPDRVEILAEQDCGWDTTTAQNTMEDWLQAYPDMNCVVCQSDEMATGIINSLQAAQIGIDKCMVIGFNSSKEAIADIRAGVMTGSVLFVIYKDQIATTMDYVFRLANGEDLSGQMVDLAGDAMFTTIDNVDEVEKLLGF